MNISCAKFTEWPELAPRLDEGLATQNLVNISPMGTFGGADGSLPPRHKVDGAFLSPPTT